MKKYQVFIISIMLFSSLTIKTYAKNDNFNKLLVDLAKSIRPEFMAKIWKKKYRSWESQLSGNRLSLNSLKKLILYWDKHVTMDAYKLKHQTEVQDWPLVLAGAKSIRTLSRILVTINSMLNRDARTFLWDKKRKHWLKRIKRML